jgi:hypothetical protein
LHQTVNDDLHQTVERANDGIEESDVAVILLSPVSRLVSKATSERRGYNFEGFKDFYLTVKARIWP